MDQNKKEEPQKIYSITEITRLIKSRLEESFPSLWVEGEISNFHRHQSGHLYFTLKDEGSQLKVVMFRSDAKKVSFDLAGGLQVICRGRINVYEPRGEYQLLAELVEPKGKGALQLAFEQLKEKLKKEGLFDPEIKKRLPHFPRKIGVVTSPRGAAIIDIIRTLERRFAKLHILIYPVKVQGEGAAEEIVAGIDCLGKRDDVELLIVGRGGGSLEDLWAFNEEKVARAIHACPLPVISAVGHEVDFTIADFVADVRASTPSAAAEMVVEKEQSFYDRIQTLEGQMVHGLKYYLQEEKHKVFSFIHHQVFQNFKTRLLNLQQKIDELDTRSWNKLTAVQSMIREDRSRTVLLQEKIIGHQKSFLQICKGRWETLSAELTNLSPFNVLKKGYALCWKNGGASLIRNIKEVSKGDTVTVSFFKGEFSCLVKDKDEKKQIASRVDKSVPS